jgi:cyclopropane-fatty-acyl-phospholipid synthase
MATKKQIDQTYNYLDEIVRLSLGQTPDFSCAMYNGDLARTLEEAQAAKHDYILNGIRFQPGHRVLDIGCGWGPLLQAVRQRGGRGLGLTLSTKQFEYCRSQGFEVRLQDWRDLTAESLGLVDGVASVGAFEHFCSIEEYAGGRQDQIYQQFFRLCRDLLPPGGRLFLQTMMWGRSAPSLQEISLAAPRRSNGYVVAVLSKFYPGSWLPFGTEQILRCAEPYFRLVSLNNGWKDYLRTMEHWSRIKKVAYSHWPVLLRILGGFFTDRDFFYKMKSQFGGYQKECFRRHIIDHERILFERA